jgi:hypothetical protein
MVSDSMTTVGTILSNQRCQIKRSSSPGKKTFSFVMNTAAHQMKLEADILVKLT